MTQVTSRVGEVPPVSLLQAVTRYVVATPSSSPVNSRLLTDSPAVVVGVVVTTPSVLEDSVKCVGGMTEEGRSLQEKVTESLLDLVGTV